MTLIIRRNAETHSRNFSPQKFRKFHLFSCVCLKQFFFKKIGKYKTRNQQWSTNRNLYLFEKGTRGAVVVEEQKNKAKSARICFLLMLILQKLGRKSAESRRENSLKISRVCGGMKTRFLLNDIRFCINLWTEKIL